MNYQQELATRSSPAYIASAAARSKQLLAKYGAWIEKYRGGMPAGFAAQIMRWESDGNFNAPGDASLGEVGFYQIAAYVPPTLGMPADARKDPETNVFLGMMEYALEVCKWKAAFPNHVELGTADSWKLARLAFSVGAGGSQGLARLALAAYPNTPRGQLYTAIANYVRANGGKPLGSQSADQVWFRVLSIESQWEIGRQTDPWSMAGPPTTVAPPPGRTYTIPAKYAAMFSQPVPIVAIVAIGGAALLLWRLI